MSSILNIKQTTTQYLAGKGTTEIELFYVPVALIEVRVDDVLMDSSAYSITKNSKIVTFTSEIASTSSVEIKYDYYSELPMLRGKKGDVGKTPELSIGEVTTLGKGESASATITGSIDQPVLNLGIPKADGSVVANDPNSDGNIVFTDYFPEETTYQVDKTLTVEGAAADAKAVGDALATKVTEAFVTNKIAEAQLSGGGSGDIDLSGYATKDQITALDNAIKAIDYPVDSVNGKTGEVTLSASDVGARPDTWMPTATDVGAVPKDSILLTEAADLNNIVDEGEYYYGWYQESIANAPVHSAFHLSVKKVADTEVSQTYTQYTGGYNAIYTRQSNSNKTAWSAWDICYTTSVKPNASDVGAVPRSGSKNIDIGFDNDVAELYVGIDGSKFYIPIGVSRFGAYHTGNKPTPVDIGAVIKAGDTMTGDLYINKVLPLLALVSPNGSSSVFKNANAEADYGSFFEDRKQDGTVSQLILDAVKDSSDILQLYSNKHNAIWNILHTGNKNLITPADIGAVPYFPQFISFSQLDSLDKSGFYIFSDNVTRLNNMDVPVGIVFNQIFDVNSRYQTVIPAGSNHVLHRAYYFGWGEWESDNPPMQVGVEYRTTKRYMGKPVYTMLYNFGSTDIDVGTKKTATPVNHQIHSLKMYYYDIYNKQAWGGDSIDSFWGMQSVYCYGTITVKRTDAGFATNESYALIEYTK